MLLPFSSKFLIKGRIRVVRFHFFCPYGMPFAIRSVLESFGKDGEDKVIHACGHDSHSAMLLAIASRLKGKIKRGTLKLLFQPGEEGGFGDLTISGCEVRNYTKGLIYINVAAVPDVIEIDNTIIHDVVCDGGDFIDSRKGGWNELRLTNSTIYNSAMKRDVLRCDDASGSVSASVVTTVNNCTFYNVGSGGANYRFFYLRFKGNSNTFTNNVVANFNNKRGFANSSSVGVPTYSNNYYYNCENLISQAEGNTQSGLTCFDTEGTVLEENPFADPDNGDFTITDELLRSYQFGDPRWY